MIRIRTPEPTDSQALIGLIQQFPTPTPSSVARLTEILVRKLGDPASYVLVAENEEGLIGYVSGCRRTAFYAGGDTAWVDEILVSPSHRGRDIGSLLMEEFERRAAADGCRLISLATAGAGPFYSGRGYETKAGYYKKYLGIA
ncbi:MAG TPA: GNAT family N-acetyltransferase [Povalibacter sp.]|uniref:GNAT family N-acetyltransferase n=1 Tax=Povalibacter sp. TaxID=1962978 RepID=UPI002CCFDE46|nr:GNAT family N-acetyltransferase [Povalibacter sp.]HMN44531.1 GNAT family N-acetyltransferase [Povalibacter sp.]